MAEQKELTDIYHCAYENIVAFIVDPRSWKTGKTCKNPRETLHRRYERKLASLLRPLLLRIHRQLQDKHKHVKIKKAIVQCNSLHPRINARLRLPWNMSRKDIPDGGTDILCLHPDRATHILTEIVLRLKPYSNSTDANSRKDWVGLVIDQLPHNQHLLASNNAETEKNREYLCPVKWRTNSSLSTFSDKVRDNLESWRKANDDTALVDLGEHYPTGISFHSVTKRVYGWFRDHDRDHDRPENTFYLADLVVSEQLSGIAAELAISDGAEIEDIRKFLKDCQWMLNRYIFSLILQAERSYSGEGPSYPDAYFFYQNIIVAGKNKKQHKMLDNLIDLSTRYSTNGNGGNNLNKRYEGCPFNDLDVIKDLFRKIRIHFEITKGEVGKYAIGYKKHAYEVACVVAGIMDVLFYDKRGSISIETIVRQCPPALDGLDDRLQDDEVPFLFRQLFRGLSKEDQLFLIPQYREHFIHSFYVFVLGVALMSYAPRHVIPESLQLKHLNGKNNVKKLLKKWFLVAMWHDIAYMIEKGDLVLEQHVLSLMREGRRQKGLLPLLPSLGNLMQADNLLSEIRNLSRGSIELCSSLINGITPEALRKGITKEDIVPKLVGDIVIAAAFERRDHGVWSAMMFNHAWAPDMSKLYFPDDGGDDEALRKKIATAIIPHHLADWDVQEMLKDYDYIRDLSKGCTTRETLEKAAEALFGGEPLGAQCDYNKACAGQPVARLLPLDDKGPLNEMGYLLGLCDMISQAGRENAELPTETGSNLGILYKEIDNKPNGILSLVLKYTQKPVTWELFRDRYVRPALFLGLTVCEEEKDRCDGIKITIESGTMGSETGFFYHPSLYREPK